MTQVRYIILKNKRRIVIALSSVFILLLYFSRNLSIIVPFIITIVALILFGYIDKAFSLRFPERYYIFTFLIFIMGTVIGGTVPFGLYYRIPIYDKIIHFTSPILISAIVFFILNRLNITLKWKLLMTVGLVFGMLGLFEIGEYLSDVLFGTLHQGVYLFDFAEKVKYEVVVTPIHDTMQDLILGLFGSLVFVVFESIEVWHKKRSLKSS
ncbi:MAG: hypothetical protein AABX90_02630 [Nanoarchaeota archaeon]